MRLLPSVTSGLLSGLSWVTVGCTGLLFNSEPSQNSTANGVAPPRPVPDTSVQPAVRQTPVADGADGAKKTAQSPIVGDAEAAIWAELRQGQGYVVMMRHAVAPGTGDPPEFRLGDCSTQRNLSEAGRQQAIAIGEAFRQQNIPVSRVLSSQWCRCLDTAKLLDLGTVEPFPALNSFFSDRSTAAQQTEQVQTFIREQQNESGVTILVTHQVNITAISNIVPQSGEFVVLRAAGTNGERGAIAVKGRLNPVEN